MSIEKSFEIKLTPQEEFQLMIDFVKEYPKLIHVIVENVNKRHSIRCPFPFECNSFPCKDLTCNADCCSNGYAYRMS